MLNIVIPENAAGNFDDLIWKNRDNEEVYKIPKRIFELVIINGIDDFTNEFLLKISGMNRYDLKSKISKYYKKSHGYYFLKNKDDLIVKTIWFIMTSSQFAEIFNMDSLYEEFIKVIGMFCNNSEKEIAPFLNRVCPKFAKFELRKIC